MDTDLIKKLNNLAQVDIDAYHAYTQAIEALGNQEIKEQLIKFQQDHVQHIKNFEKTVKDLGGESIGFSRDFKGFLISGYTSVRSMTGDVGTLKAMDTNEAITNSSYDDMLKEEDLPGDIRQMIEEHSNDEKRHLAYIKKKLEEINT